MILLNFRRMQLCIKGIAFCYKSNLFILSCSKQYRYYIIPIVLTHLLGSSCKKIFNFCFKNDICLLWINLKLQEERKSTASYFIIWINTIKNFTFLFSDYFSTRLYKAEILLNINFMPAFSFYIIPLAYLHVTENSL